jgi:hypothetical protein
MDKDYVETAIVYGGLFHILHLIDLFKNYGGDIENYFFKVQIAHANRVFGLSNNHILKITIDDLNKGLTLIRSYKKKEKQIIPFMYS